MKIVFTGATGYVGKSVLKQCLLNPSITSVIALSRRDPEISNAKLRWIKHDDFTNFPDHIVSEIKDAEACIYCLGTNVPIKPPELNRTINFEYALATAQMFAELTRESTKTFRFVYLSGALPEKDPNKHLWFVAENRRMRGELENALLQLDAERRSSGFRIHIARPGFVQPQGAVVRTWIIGRVFNAIMQRDLAVAMVKLAIEGGEGALVENEQLISLGGR